MNKWLAISAAVGGMAAAGAAWQAVEGRRDRRRFPPPGELFTLPDGRRLHAIGRDGPRVSELTVRSLADPAPGGGARSGAAAPTVVFEAALAASSIGWEQVLSGVAADAPVFAYDRAGMGWSDAPPRGAGGPRTGREMVEDLRTLLAVAEVPRPIILVGHSYGGLLARLYTALYPREVAGLVLVDAAAPEQWTEISAQDRLRLKVGRHLAGRGVWAARLGVARLVMELALARRAGGASGPGAGAPELTKSADGADVRGAAAARGAVAGAEPRRTARPAPETAARAVVTAVTFGILGPSDRGLLTPVAQLSPAMRQTLARLWIQPKFYAGIREQLAALPGLAAEVQARERPLAIPVGVLSASQPSPQRMAEQERAVKLSPLGWHVVAPSCGHWVQLDQPECVIAAVRRVVAQARA